MDLLLTAGRGVVIQEPLWGKGPTLRWWAEGGLVHCEDGTTGEIISLTVKDALKRIQALSHMRASAAESKAPSQFRYLTVDERERLQRFIDRMVEIIRQAQEQGSPDNPQALADRQRRRPTTVVVSAPVFSNFE